MNREILADNGYSLSINSFLFAILVDHICDDEIEIAFGRSILKVRVKELKNHVLKDESGDLYEIIEEIKISYE